MLCLTSRHALSFLLASTLVACGGAVDTVGSSDPTPIASPTGNGTGTGTGTAPPIETSPGNAPPATGLSNGPPSKIGDPASSGTPFHLVLSNQSFDRPLVDLRVTLDGMPVVRGDFPVGSQHSYYAFDFTLPAGNHAVQVSSSVGGVTINQTVTLAEGPGAERWGVAMYWTNGGCAAGKNAGGEPCKQEMTWNLMESAPGFD
jgi:hypothetical protein